MKLKMIVTLALVALIAVPAVDRRTKGETVATAPIAAAMNYDVASGSVPCWIGIR